MHRFCPHLACIALLIGCGSTAEVAGEDVMVLDPEPSGAPAEVVDGDMSCLGSNNPPPPEVERVQLTGFVRTLTDPTMLDEVLRATVEVFSSDGAKVAEATSGQPGFGRAAAMIPVGDEGWNGHAVAIFPGYLHYRLKSNRPVTDSWEQVSTRPGWFWMATQDDVDSWAAMLGVTQSPDAGILVGAVRDCDRLLPGVANAVVQVNGSTDGIHYIDGPYLEESTRDCYSLEPCSRPFAPAPELTFTNVTGRFLVPNFSPGNAVVRAFGRLYEGGPLTLLASIDTEVAAGQITAVALEPRMGSE